VESIRKQLPLDADGDHAGLILDSYLRYPVKAPEHIESKKALLNKVVTASKRDNGPFILARERWLKSVIASGGRLLELEYKSSSTVLGFGGEHVTDSGLTLHHTYGVPYLPGSSLKGIASHWAHDVLGKQEGNPDWERDGLLHRLLFGTNDSGGLIVFLDGWPTTDSPLIHEVMTPHHPKHYVGKGKDFVPASDFDEPTPIHFLAVNTLFFIGFLKRDEEVSDDWFNLTQDILSNALFQDGIGGKTSNGYGRFIIRDSSDQASLISKGEKSAQKIREQLHPRRSAERPAPDASQEPANVEKSAIVAPPENGERFDVVFLGIEKGNRKSTVYKIARVADNHEFFVASIQSVDKKSIQSMINKHVIFPVEVKNSPTSWADVELARKGAKK